MRKNNQGVTLIALVITIIVLLILAGVTIATLTDQNGILTKTNQSKEENNKQTATEILNLKITNVQMSKYAEEQRMPTLKELADSLDPEKDKDIKSVTKTSQKISSLEWINDDYTSIFTILKDYPQYEFQIDDKLKLASINGVKIADNNNDEKNKEIEELRERIEKLENKEQEVKTTMLSPDYANREKFTFSNKTYTVPEEGYIQVHFNYTAGVDAGAGVQDYLYINDKVVCRNSASVGWQNVYSPMLPVKKDDVIKIQNKAQQVEGYFYPIRY